MSVTKQDYLSELNEGAGYILDVKLTQPELDRIREMIHTHAVDLVSKYYPRAQRAVPRYAYG